jgi:hypothetical protein
VLAFTDVFDLFVHELSGLRRRCLASTFVAASAFDRLLLRHSGRLHWQREKPLR